MAKNLHDVLRDASELPDVDRATLAGILIESLEGEPDDTVEAAWAAEIDKRAAEIDRGEVELVPWEKVREQLFGR